MNLCPQCFEPLDDFSPCACVFGLDRAPAPPATEGASKSPFKSNMRSMVERKLRHRALQSADAEITTKDPTR